MCLDGGGGCFLGHLFSQCHHPQVATELLRDPQVSLSLKICFCLMAPGEKE